MMVLIGWKNRAKPVEQTPQPKPQKKEEDGCKIKIKNSPSGKQIEFSGKCSKEQIAVAREQLAEGKEEFDEEEI